jgi:hypothetical protein
MKSVEWKWVRAHKITKTVVKGNINLLGSNPIQLTSEGAGFIMYLLQKHVHIGLDTRSRETRVKCENNNKYF